MTELSQVDLERGPRSPSTNGRIPDLARSAAVHIGQLSDPYKGLEPFSEADARFFFGRAAEAETIAAYLVASRITLLYGPSGVGKSSLLRAGVAQPLRERARQNFLRWGHANFVLVYFRNWRHDPLVSLAELTRRAAARAVSEPSRVPDVDRSLPLAESLHAYAELINGDVLVILDQFEDFFLYGSREDGPDTFASQLADAVADRRLRANFLISLREDALGSLDRFKLSIPGLFDTTYRLRPMHREAAAEAITGPIRVYNALQPPGTRPVQLDRDVVTDVLQGVTASALPEAGLGGIELESRDDQIELAFLSLVMKRLWEAEKTTWNTTSSDRTIRATTLATLGGPKHIIQSHLDVTLDTLPRAEQDIAAHIFRYLITSSGRKIAYSASELVALEPHAGPVGRLQLVLQKLAGKPRVLRRVTSPRQAEPRYEVFHDVLAACLLNWRRDYLQEAEQRRLRWIAKSVAGVAGCVLLFLLGYALEQRREALDSATQALTAQTQVAEAQTRAEAASTEVSVSQANAAALSLATNAAARLTSDPELGMLLAIEAVHLDDNPQTREVLRQAVARPQLSARLRRDGPVNQVALSPDGTRFAVADQVGPVVVYQAQSGRPIFEIPGQAAATRVAYSPDGARIASGDSVGGVLVSDASTGSLIAELGVHTEAVTSVVFSPDGKRLVTTSNDAQVNDSISSGSVWLWDTSTWHPVTRLGGHRAGVNSAAFSADSRRLVTASDDNTARVWTAERGDSIATFDQGDVVFNAALSPTGDKFVTAAKNGSRLLKTTAAPNTATALVANTQVTSAVFSADGNKVAVAGEDAAVRVFDASSGQQTLALNGHTGAVWGVTFTRQDDLLVSNSKDSTTRMWDARSGALMTTLGGHTSAVTSADVRADGEWLVTAGFDGVVDSWDLTATYPVAQVTPAQHPFASPLNQAVFSPDGRSIATAGSDGSVRIWTVADGTVRVVTEGDQSAFNSVAYSPDGNRLAAASNDGTARIWDLSSFAAPLILDNGAGAPVFQVAFRPDGAQIATASSDGAARIWDLITGREVFQVSHAAAVRDVAYSPDGRLLATGSWDRTVRIWSAQNGEQAPHHVASFIWQVNRLAFSPDGASLVVAGADPSARLYSVTTGTVTGALRGHTADVTDAAFDPGAQVVATASRDRTVRLWDTRGAVPILLAQLRGSSGPVTSIAFSADARRIAAASADGAVRVYTCDACGDTRALLAAAESRVTRRLTSEERQRFTVAYDTKLETPVPTETGN